MRLRRCSATIAALIASCALSACRPATGVAPAQNRLVIAIPQEPPSMSALLVEGPSSTTIVPLVYSYLLTMDEHGNLVPDLATEVPSRQNGGISPDGRTIVYHLRRNVRWQDGAPLTAADVVFTQNAIMNPRNDVFSRYGNDRVQTITAPTPYTVRVTLRTPFSPIVTQFFGPANNYGILPAHLLRGYADLNHVPFNERPIGSGPYRVQSWERGDRVTLVANRAYFRGPPRIAEIVLKFVPDSNTVLNQLRTGEIDAYFFSDPAHLREFASIPRLRITRAPFAAFGDLLFNVRRPAIADPQIRRAIVAALDIPAIARNATRGAQTAADANRALFGPTFDPSIPAPAYDPAGARRVLAPRHLSLALAYESGKAASASVAVQVQAQLKAAGVNLDVYAYTADLFRAPASSGGPLFGGKFDLAFYEIFTTGDWDTSWYLGCAQIPPNGFNVSRLCDPALERAIQTVDAAYDPRERRRFASLAQRRVATLLPFVSLWSQNAIDVAPANLREFKPSPESPYWNAWQWSF